jgi:ectoine hydroxylase
MPRTNIFLVFNSVGNRLVAPFSGKPPRPEYIATRREIAALVPCMGALDAAGPA